MQDIGGFPGFEVEFDKEAGLVDDRQVLRLLDLLAEGTVTDLFVFAHGWNNDLDDARALTLNLFDRVRAVLQGPYLAGIAHRRFAVVTVLWPSKKFADRDLIPGGAASLESPEVLYVQQQLEDLKAVFQSPEADAALEAAKRLVPIVENSSAAQKEYANLLRSLLPRPQTEEEDASDVFFALPGDELLDRLKSPVLSTDAASAGEQGGAASFGDLPPFGRGGAVRLGRLSSFVTQGVGNIVGHVIGAMGSMAGTVATTADAFVNRVIAAASNLANLTTYYQMKERAGLVGVRGLSPVLRRIRDQIPGVKIHLVGHSFGGRVVTAAADGAVSEPAVHPNSMTLLQAAFSHNGFARLFDGKRDGFFRKVVTGKKVSGPILISCSINDWAVGLAYPLASRIAGQQASALVGGAGDPYGGIGRNGAQKTPEAEDCVLGAVGSPYSFETGRLYNLRADHVIGGHSDICKDEVAYAMLAAVAMT